MQHREHDTRVWSSSTSVPIFLPQRGPGYHVGWRTSSVHSSSKALLIAAVLALRPRRDADLAVLVRLADEREPVTGIAQEERL